MKTPAFIMGIVAALFATSVTATELETGGDEKQRSATKSALKREIVEHLSGAVIESNCELDYIDVMLSVNTDGTVQLVDWSHCHSELETFLVKRIAKMELAEKEIMTGETFGFRVRFDLK